MLNIYQNFIYGFFSEYTIPLVLLIALGQLGIAVFLAFGGPLLTVGVFGGIVFLLAITPLGFGSGFPCTLILALALGVMLWKLRRLEMQPGTGTCKLSHI